MSLKNALKYLELSKNTYFYNKNRRPKTKRKCKLYLELKEILLELTEKEPASGYNKVTDYIKRKHNWNRKKFIGI